MTRQKKTKPAAEFIAELVEEASFSKHLFDASWQGRQYDRASRDVPDGCVLVCQDFAENFKCHFQDEAQGARWGHAQVTLHASVASYRCTFRTVHLELYTSQKPSFCLWWQAWLPRSPPLQLHHDATLRRAAGHSSPESDVLFWWRSSTVQEQNCLCRFVVCWSLRRCSWKAFFWHKTRKYLVQPLCS